jgi:hypothetical protein
MPPPTIKVPQRYCWPLLSLWLGSTLAAAGALEVMVTDKAG